jgi:Bax protein
MKNLNTHAAYTQLRNIRYQMRQSDQELNSEYLALGLQKYSAKGMDYVNMIRSMLKTNNDLLLASR